MKKHTHLFIAMLLIMLTGWHCTNAPTASANLLVNGDAELPNHDSVPEGWQNVQGHWHSPEGDSTHQLFGLAQHGYYLFFAGADTLGILQQDVDISRLAKSIDAGKQKFIFSTYVKSLDQGPKSDQARVTVFALNHDKQHGKLLYDSDSTRSLNKWLLLQDTFLVSPATRFIRVQLMAIRNVGSDNDGYFDHAGLLAIPPDSERWVWIAVAAFLLVTALHYFLFKMKRTTVS